jgi:hypothetical protein
VSVMRRQAGISVLVVAGVALGFLAVGYHGHGLPVVHTLDQAVEGCADESAISTMCTVCTLVHISPTPAVDCLGLHAPRSEQLLGSLDSVVLPDGPVLCSHASRAPPMPHGLEA